jgi:hypothetical protein
MSSKPRLKESFRRFSDMVACGNDCRLKHQMAMMSLQQQTQQHTLFFYIYLVLQCKTGSNSGARKAEGECWRQE